MSRSTEIAEDGVKQISKIQAGTGRIIFPHNSSIKTLEGGVQNTKREWRGPMRPITFNCLPLERQK